MKINRILPLAIAASLLMPSIAATVAQQPLTAQATPVGNATPTVVLQPDGKLLLREGGPGFLAQPIEPEDLTAERLNSKTVTIETSSKTPMDQVQRTIDLLKAAGATAFMILPAKVPPEELKMKIFPLSNSSAAEVVLQLNNLYSHDKATVVADQRTNAVIVRSPATTLTEIETLVNLLDSTKSRDDGNSPRSSAIGAAKTGGTHKPASPNDPFPAGSSPQTTPNRAAAPRSPPPRLTVQVQPDGKYFLRDGGLEAPFLPVQLADLDARRVGNARVQIEAAAETPASKVLEAIDALKKAGAYSFVLHQVEVSTEGTELKIFSLANGSAIEMVNQFIVMYADKATFVADQRTNSIIARGPANLLLEVEALAIRLDAVDNPSPMRSLLSANHEGAPPALRGDYDRHNRRAQQVAGEIQKLATDKTTARDNDELRKQLRREVEAAFAARQQVQQAELAQLRERLGRIERSIAARERVKDKIVENRVAELLDPNLQWEPPAAATPPASATLSPRRTQNVPVTPPVSNSLGSSSSAAAPEPTAPSLRWPLSGASGSSLILRSPEEFGRELNASEVYLAHTKKLSSRGFVSQATLEADERRLKSIQAEYAAQLRLLELELQSAEQTLDSSNAELHRANALYKSNTISVSEVDRLRLAAGQARVKLEQLKTLYELYRDAGKKEERHKANPTTTPPAIPFPPAESKPATSLEPPAKPATAPPPLESSSSLQWDVLGVRTRAVVREAVHAAGLSGGLELIEIRPGSPAALAGLRSGDVLVGLHVWETVSPQALEFVLSRLEATPETLPRGEQPIGVRSFVLRNGKLTVAMLSLVAALKV